jgi:protein-S-isoprenylcysteine O-methyltransferase
MITSLTWRVLFWGWVASEAFIAVVTRTRRGAGNVRDRGSQIVLWIVIVAAITASEWIGATVSASMFGKACWLKAAGVIVLVAGLGIRWTAIFTLGNSFSANVVVKESQRICNTWLYRFLRHPSYLGLLLVFLAAGLHSRNWISLGVVLVPTAAALLYRIHVEEAALREAFVEEYAAYCKSTKRLIPGVY